MACVAPRLVLHLVQVEGLVERAFVHLVPCAGVQHEPLFPREDVVIELVVVREGEVERSEEQWLILVFERPESREEQELVEHLSAKPCVSVVVVCWRRGHQVGLDRTPLQPLCAEPTATRPRPAAGPSSTADGRVLRKYMAGLPQ